MTADREPSTEAGRRDHREYHANPEAPDPCDRLTSILAIEDEARAEPRRDLAGLLRAAKTVADHPESEPDTNEWWDKVAVLTDAARDIPAASYLAHPRPPSPIEAEVRSDLARQVAGLVASWKAESERRRRLVTTGPHEAANLLAAGITLSHADRLAAILAGTPEPTDG